MKIKDLGSDIKDKIWEYWTFEVTVADYTIMVIAKVGAFACGLGLGYHIWG